MPKQVRKAVEKWRGIYKQGVKTGKGRGQWLLNYWTTEWQKINLESPEQRFSSFIFSLETWHFCNSSLLFCSTWTENWNTHTQTQTQTHTVCFCVSVWLRLHHAPCWRQQRLFSKIFLSNKLTHCMNYAFVQITQNMTTNQHKLHLHLE